MEEKTKDFLAGRVRDLATRAYMNNFVTHTDFLSVSEIAMFHQILSAEGVSNNVHEYCGAKYVIYGGFDEAERAMICFLPDYMDEETFLMMEKSEASVLSCVRIRPVNKKFADELNHRDYLGSLMNLGIERDQLGDILTGDEVAYVFATIDIAQMICNELIKLRDRCHRGDDSKSGGYRRGGIYQCAPHCAHTRGGYARWRNGVCALFQVLRTCDRYQRGRREHPCPQGDRAVHR